MKKSWLAVLAISCLSWSGPLWSQEETKEKAGKTEKPEKAEEKGKPEEAKDQKPQADEAAGEEENAEATVDPSVWVLDFDVQKVRTIVLLDGALKGQVYWYMLYTVENKTGEERQAFLSISATSDRNKTYSDVHLPTVERAIEKKVGTKLWGKDDLYEEQKDRNPDDEYYHYTTVKAGEKRGCVAIFNKLDPGANHVNIFVRGLSNDLHLIEKEDGTRIIEERMFALEYNRPSDEYEINLDRFNLKKKEWIKKRTELVIPGD
ncbi:MAG: hypothetical protein HY717_05390 [Planctomycetes bacterium]|nr:hypothetical protein [Planctomycetota bacterium]